ncbi:MAG TPA: YdcF family protein [Actinomycetota bacterium]|nr:YdcF family protein [Actinomycetota bacterium]
MGFIRRHRILATLVVVGLIALGLLSATASAVWQVAHRDEARKVDHVDAILVLGAAQYNGRPSLVFESRLRHAALLYRQGRASTVVVLGGNQPGDISTEADAGRNWLIADGVPSTDVVADAHGNSTLESLQAAADYMDRADLQSAFLVSDPWHNLRIRRMAHDLGIQGFVSATGASAAKTQWTRFSGYVRETFAYLYYRVFHR